MKRFSYFSVLFFISVFLSLTSCDGDENSDNVSDYSTGAWIVNQGKFQDGTGTLTYYNEDVVVQDVFGKENNGAFLGNIVQSIIKVNQKYYIAVNNADKVVVVDAQSFQFITEIAVDYPRYFASEGNKLYVSSWNKDFTRGAVYELDTDTDVIKDRIDLPKTAEGMTISNNQLFVALTDVTLKSKDIAIIGISDNTVIKTMEVCDNPQTAVTDLRGEVWILCAGHSDWQNPENNTAGALVQMSPDHQNVSKFNLGGFYLATNGDKSRIYVSNGQKISDFTISRSGVVRNLDIGSRHYGIGVSPITQKLFATTSDFASRGETIIFDYEQSSSERIPSGVGASFVYFSE